MLRSIIKYGGLALVIIGIILVMKNLFNSDSKMKNNKIKKTTIVERTYDATINLLDEETKKYITGAKLVLSDDKNNVLSEWTTESGSHLVTNLKNGTYTIKEEIPEYYKSDNDTTTFTIKGKNKTVTIYNQKMNDEEIRAYEKEQREKNTTANEIGVENTLSTKDITLTIISILTIILGLDLIFLKKEN